MTVRVFLATVLTSAALLIGCDASEMPILPAKSQVPSHVAEFMMPSSDYPKLLAALDSTGDVFQLKRVGAAAGLSELHGRDVLFAAYESTNVKEWRGALDVTDVKAPGKVLVRVYGDYFPDVEQREKFVGAISLIVERHGGKLERNEAASQAKP